MLFSHTAAYNPRIFFKYFEGHHLFSRAINLGIQEKTVHFLYKNTFQRRCAEVYESFPKNEILF